MTGERKESKKRGSSQIDKFVFEWEDKEIDPITEVLRLDIYRIGDLLVDCLSGLSKSSPDKNKQIKDNLLNDLIKDESLLEAKRKNQLQPIRKKFKFPSELTKEDRKNVISLLIEIAALHKGIMSSIDSYSMPQRDALCRKMIDQIRQYGEKVINKKGENFDQILLEENTLLEKSIQLRIEHISNLIKSSRLTDEEKKQFTLELEKDIAELQLKPEKKIRQSEMGDSPSIPTTTTGKIVLDIHGATQSQSRDEKKEHKENLTRFSDFMKKYGLDGAFEQKLRKSERKVIKAEAIVKNTSVIKSAIKKLELVIDCINENKLEKEIHKKMVRDSQEYLENMKKIVADDAKPEFKKALEDPQYEIELKSAVGKILKRFHDLKIPNAPLRYESSQEQASSLKKRS